MMIGINTGTGRKQTRRVAESHPGSPRTGAHRDLPAGAAVILKHCRCMDCQRFSRVGALYSCAEYIGGTSVVWATGERFCDPPPYAWHYCAHYHGPQISTDVWVWPRAAKKKPVPSRGRPGDGPATTRPAGGNRPGEAHSTKAGIGPFKPSGVSVGPLAAHVGPRSKISANPATPATAAEGRDVAEPGANGSSLADHAGARGGNSRPTGHSLF